MKCSDHIFVLVKIYTGFASDTAVHLSEKCGWYLNKIDSAKVSCCTESCEVTNDTASKCNNQTFTIQLRFNQFFVQILYGMKMLAFFACFKNKKGNRRGNRRKGRFQRICVQGCNVGIGNNTHFATV